MLNPADSTSHFQSMIQGEAEFDLPDEIVIEILSRLPAVEVVRVRCLCKRWRDLTCCHSFTLLQLRRCQYSSRCLPVVLFDRTCFDESERVGFRRVRGYDQYLWDQWWEPLQTTPKIYQFGKLSKFRLLFSHGGLVVMNHRSQEEKVYMVINPIYHGKVQIRFSQELRIDDVYGVFFHPSLEEYCTLWRIAVSGDCSEYRILTLGSKPCWRKINNPWSHIDKACWGIPPVLIDEHLYWVVQPEGDDTLTMSFPADIMEFDIRKEEFDFISSPLSGPYRGCHYNISLLDIGGLLSLVQTSPFRDSQVKEPFKINIWTLKDHARKLWTMCSYQINTDTFFNYRRPMALVNDELVLRDWGPLFTCNLKLGTVRVYGDDLNYGTSCTHLMSLASLRNCKSEIYMDIKGEVEKEA